MRRYTIMMIILLFAISIYAIDETSLSMGFHFGTSTGSGYSFRKWGDLNGAQATIAAYSYGKSNPSFPSSFWDSESDQNTITVVRDGRKTNFTLGLNYLWSLHKGEWHRFYIISGGAFSLNSVKEFRMDYVRSDTYSYYDPRPTTKRSSWEQHNKWSIGAGPGFEIKIGGRFHFTLELPMTLNEKGDIVMYIPAAGLYYYFK